MDVPKFEERCRNESTNNVVFLLQRMKYQLLGPPDDGETYEVEDGHVYRLSHEGVLVEPVPVSLDAWQMLAVPGEFGDIPCVLEEWHTETVWLSREEANAHVASRKYDYPDGKYRIYGVCAMGQLVEVLKDT